ncbi:MAG: ABC transporter permease [Synergistaceae bacterium]|nr:ABC transporter permease [Synergistaceae bacterium]
MDEVKSEKSAPKGHSSFLDILIGRPEVSVLVPMVVLISIAQAVNRSFLSWDNLTSIFRSNSFVAIIAIAMTFVFIALELDLSVGSVVALTSMIAGLLLVRGVPPVIAVIAGVLSGTVCGLVTGYVIVHFNIPSMIGSLGMMFILRGVVFVVTEGQPLYPMPDGFERMGLGSFLNFPIPALVFVVLAVIFGFILKNTIYGRTIYAIGGNRETAWLCGINVNLVRMSTYWLTGTFSGIAGVMLTSRLSSAQPSAGTGWEMLVIASVIVGGTSMFGGVGTILGTVLGSILVGMLTNMLVMMKVSVYWQNIAIGIIILLSVIFDQYRKKLSAARLRG